MKVELSRDQIHKISEALDQGMGLHTKWWMEQRDEHMVDTGIKILAEHKEDVTEIKNIFAVPLAKEAAKEAAKKQKRESKIYQRYVKGNFKTKKDASEKMKVGYSTLLRIIKENEEVKQDE